MSPSLYYAGGVVSFASILLLALALYLHVRRTRRHLASLNLEELKKNIANLLQKTEDLDHSIEACRKEEAEIKIKTSALEGEIDAIKDENRRYLGIFKTVLYGFDYIVQGCKNALEIEAPEQQTEEKQIASEGE
jgi:septal ring factor EnvC (AmiA/AmiB activator)